MDALKLATLFHDTYERLAPSFGYETRDDTTVFDAESKNGKLMVATCGEILKELFPNRSDGLPQDMLDEGWVEFTAKNTQPSHDTWIKQIMYRSGDITEAKCKAGMLNWHWDFAFPETDIVAYLPEKNA